MNPAYRVYELECVLFPLTPCGALRVRAVRYADRDKIRPTTDTRSTSWGVRGSSSRISSSRATTSSCSTNCSPNSSTVRFRSLHARQASINANSHRHHDRCSGRTQLGQGAHAQAPHTDHRSACQRHCGSPVRACPLRRLTNAPSVPVQVCVGTWTCSPKRPAAQPPDRI